MQAIKRDLQKYNNITLPSATTITATGVGVVPAAAAAAAAAAAIYQLKSTAEIKKEVIIDNVPTSVITSSSVPNILLNNNNNSIVDQITDGTGGGGGSGGGLSSNSSCSSNSSTSSSPPSSSTVSVSSHKRLKLCTDDWISPVSPQSQPLHLTSNINTNSKSMLPSSPQSIAVTVGSATNNGSSTPAHSFNNSIAVNDFASPLSNSSYDPYSPGVKSCGQDDISPRTPLINHGYSSSDSCEIKKKKGPTCRQQEELCLVCGDRASGYHYNALTCEGCKGFFRRSVTKMAVYQCKYGNICEIDMYMRRKCQECRFKKCVRVGMRPECVVPEVQCAVKRKEKKALKEKDKPNSTTRHSPDSNSPIKSEIPDPIPNDDENLKLRPEQDELIHRLVYYQRELESPSPEDINKIAVQSRKNDDPSDSKFQEITDITILTVQLIVEFAKRLPGFDKLVTEDRIALLKACSSEVMMLRAARSYDAQSDSILFVNNQSNGRESYVLAGMSGIIDNLLKFCRTMYSLKVDNAEYALLTAIVIFSGRPCVQEEWKVEKIQEIYVETLKNYVEDHRRPKHITTFAKLLSILIELRTLGNENSEFCLKLKLGNRKLPAFLAEIWDVDVRTI